MTQQDPARVIVAVAAEGDDEFIWSRLKMLPELFAAGPVAIRVGFFGAEGARPARPFIASRWTTDADDLADLLDKARTRCICGCYVKVGDILEQALRETRQGPVQAVVIVGDHFYGDFEAAMATAEQLARLEPGCSCSSKAAPTSTEQRIPGCSRRQRAAAFSRSILTSSESPNGCRDCWRRSPISRSAAWLLWKRVATRRPVCYSNR